MGRPTKSILQLPPAIVPLSGDESIELVQALESFNVRTRSFVLPTDPILTMGSMAGFLPGSRLLASSPSISVIDGGPGGTVTLALNALGSLFGNPTALVGLSPVNGVASTMMRSDAAPALDQGISPLWTGNHAFNNSILIAGSPVLTQLSGDSRYYTQAAADARFLTQTQADARYYTQAQSDARYYTQAQADANFLDQIEGDARYVRLVASQSITGQTTLQTSNATPLIISRTGATTSNTNIQFTNTANTRYFGIDNSGNFRIGAAQDLNASGTLLVLASRSVASAGSITGGGDLSADRSLSLSGDSTTPGNSMLYGTNASGVKGWYAQPTSGSLVTPAALTKTDDTNVTLTLGGTPATALLQATSITVGWTGTLAATRGGTGFGSYAVGDLLYAGTTSSLAKLTDVAVGSALISGGINTAPSWGKIDLTAAVTGILPVANGGTGVATLTGYVKGNGTSAMTASATIPFTDITGAPSLTPASPTTSVQFNNSGAFGGDADFTYNSTTNTITLGAASGTGTVVGAAGTSGLNGGDVALKGGTGFATGTSGGGAVTIQGGVGGNAIGSGGIVIIQGGTSPVEGNGASVQITASSAATASATARNGGNVTIATGTGISGGTNGSFRVSTGGAERLEILGNGGWELSNTTGTAGQALLCGGAASSPTWGTLGVAAGGTGATTLTGYVKGAGTGTMTASATIPYSDLTGTPTIPTGATPTQSAGLAAVAGSAATFIRSDGAPAIDQAIAPTWSGQHIFNTIASAATNTYGIKLQSNTPGFQFNETDGAADNQRWDVIIASETMRFRFVDNTGTVANWMTIDRTGIVGDGISLIATTLTHVGQTVLNPAYTSSSAACELFVRRSFTASAGTGVGNSPAMQFNNDTSSDGVILQGGSTAGFQVYINKAGGGWNEKMRVTPDGSVQIGTNSASTMGLLSYKNSATDECARLRQDGTGDALIIDKAGGTRAKFSGDGVLWTDGGTTSLPGIAFANDTDTGILRVGANQIAITAAGSANGYALFFTNTTTTNDIAWQIRPTATMNGWLMFTESGVADRWQIGIKGGSSSLFFSVGAISARTDRMTLDGSGNLTATSFNATSARALKRETGAPHRACDILARLRPILFRWLSGEGEEQLGLIAEEVREVCPQLSDGKTVMYDRLALLLLSDWQERYA